MSPWLTLAGLAVAGVLLLRRLAPGLRPLPEGVTLREGVLVALAGFLGTDLLTALLAGALELPDPPPLATLMPLRALAGLSVAGVLLAVVARRGGVAALGLRRSGSAAPLLVGVAAWLAFLPVPLILSLIEDAVLRALGSERPEQRWITEFLGSPEAQGSVAAWLAMVLALPFCEELFFRGGLYGGLRCYLGTPWAVAASGLAFGLVHDPAYILPTAALGAALALLYERTGSLLAPVAFHALHNAFTLAMVSHPEWAG